MKLALKNWLSNFDLFKCYRCLPLIAIILYFINILISALYTGGRWDLNQQIAFGDRFSNNIYTYSNGITDLYIPSSPYWPGVGFLSCAINNVLKDLYTTNQILITLALSIGGLYLYSIYKITLKIYPILRKRTTFTLLCIIYIMSFSLYKSYMVEFKPDTFLLLIMSCIFLLHIADESYSVKNIILITFLLFISTFFKQTSFILYVFTCLLILVSPKVRLLKKVIVTSIYVVVAALGMFLLFKIDNLFYYTVTIMRSHELLSFESILGTLKESFYFNFFFLLVIGYYFVLKIRKSKYNKIEFLYYIFAILWFGFSFISMLKKGGNRGNFEVGIIVFLPFYLYSLSFLIDKFGKPNLFLVPILLLLIMFSAYKIRNNSALLITKYETDRRIVEFMRSNNYKGKNAFIDGDTYVISKMSGINIITDYETTIHFNNIRGYDFRNLKVAFKDEYYDLIILSTNHCKFYEQYQDQDIKRSFLDNYIQVNNGTNLYVTYARKNIEI